ncbi:Transporter of the ATP-binding cassette (ABC) [Ceratocystis pirilliformis]|uniref:Transporter of the ATP-binding cassette (ABC) n=1 Tax=Ceratocystis pirilliformis TaxID=259994 RepID=A0ABR3YHV4_9PEZI
MAPETCSWPIWEVDDFTACFKTRYLNIAFPITIVSISCLQFIASALSRSFDSRRNDGYISISSDAAHQHTDLPPDTAAEAELCDSSEDDVEINGGRLALAKTNTRGSIAQADKPPAEHFLIIVEVIAIIGLIFANSYPLFHFDKVAGPIARTVSWSYVLILASLRLFLGNSKWRVPHLWNHTAAIYGCLWIIQLVLFRSALVHPIGLVERNISIIQLILSSLLWGIALTERKGNKTVVLEWEDGIEPSREPLASLLSLATFGWVDAIVWQGYNKTMEMDMVWNLLPKDKAAAIISNYRSLKKTSTLAFHLLKYFKGMLLYQCLMAALSGALTFVPTLLLRAIVQYIEQPTITPKNVVWLYVILLPTVDFVRSFADGMALWIGRKICIRIRAIMVGEIYAKALRRKAASGNEKSLGEDKKKAKNNGDSDDGIVARAKRALGLGKKKDDSDSEADADNDDKNGNDEQANLGTIINLMSVDSFKVAEITAYLHFLCAAAPVQLTLAIVLLWQVMGRSSIPGFVVMVILLPVNYTLALGFSTTSKKIMGATDKRIGITNEILQNIRIIKYFAWERRFGAMVDEKREKEIRALRSRYILWSIAVVIWNSVPVLITFFTFVSYTLIEKKPLLPSTAFTAMSLFMLLRIPLDQFGDMIAHVQETKVSIDRIEEFLMEEETEKYDQLGEDNVDDDGNKIIGIRDATFIWGGKNAVREDGSMAFRLLDINVDFQIGKLNIIAGPTGAGKSSLLMALLGEMTIIKGCVYCPGGRSREDVRVDPETGLANTLAYAAQSPWLVNATIKENILFSAPFDEDRYKAVVVACALERDFNILDDGDETLVGEKGISLSGGQKQRISVARALYSNSQHVILDDCLSAVDSHTAQWIFANCIRGPLMHGRTCIMVTHNTQLCVPASDFVVVLENGRIVSQGSPDDVIGSGKLGEEIQRSKGVSREISRLPSRVPSSVGSASNETAVEGSPDGTSPDATSKKDVTKKFKRSAMEENKAVGSVKWSVLILYLKSMGSWWFWVVALAVFWLQQLSTVASSIWVREWSNQYVPEKDNLSTMGINAQGSQVQAGVSSSIFAASTSAYLAPQTWLAVASSNGTNPEAPSVNATYYITVLAIIGLVGAFAAFMRDIWVFYGSLTASRSIHSRLIESVTRAKFKFFDVTPLGQIMNRFSKDLEAVDQEIAPIALSVAGCALGIIITIVLIATITPLFLVAAFFITLLFLGVGILYISASRDLKRLESVQRSPLFQQFGETLSGMTTIRAYGDERRFIRENLAKINAQSRPFIYLWACNRWLALRSDLLGDLVSFSAGVFIVLSLGKIDPGAAGISLSYAISFTENILWLVRLYAMNEQNMNSVERIQEYIDVEQEAPAVIEDSRPPHNWPSQGSVEFIDYTTSYREDLDPVLRNVSFKIEPRQKVGIVGRTGAGKSSLALALFRALEAETGKIVVDGVDISKIGLEDLRSNITIVPQEPTLFQGTLRTNLDPFEAFEDADIFAALRRVQLIGPDETPGAPPGTSTPSESNKNIFLDLSSPVSESGNNLSQGQRQLLCLARAMLRNPKVLLMDEATASIDYTTDSKIQGTIRELTSTIITIAHRLQTIADYDRVLVLDKGEVKEFAHPYELMIMKEGIFKGMCETGGEYETLLTAAKKAYDVKSASRHDE